MLSGGVLPTLYLLSWITYPDAGKAEGDGGGRDRDRDRDTLGGAAKRPSSLRSAVPRTNSTKGFSVYCDPKEASGGGGLGGRGSRTGASGSGSGSGSGIGGSSKRGSPMTSASRRREAGSATGGGGETAKSPGDKENDPRPAFGGGGGGVRVPVNGPISRRPVARSASSVGSSAREAVRGGRIRAEMSGSGGGGGGVGVGGTKGAAGSRKAAGFRRSASAVVTSHAEQHRRGTSARDGGGDCARGKASAAASGRALGAAAGSAAAGAVATPRARSSSSYRGGACAAGSSPATPTAFSSTYRSPLPRSSPATAGSTGGGGGRVSARTVAVGGGVTPRNQATTGKGDARQRLDFGGTPTPRSSRQQRESPLGSSRSSGGGGGGGGGKVARSRRLASSCPASKASKASKDLPASGDSAASGRRGQAKASVAVATPAGGGSAAANPRPPQAELERDTLESMHEVLAAAFAAGGTEQVSAGGGGGSSTLGRSGAARGTRASAAAAAAAAAAREAAAAADEADSAAPTVWVTRYVDYSSKYGLGFLLSDGSAGVYFNDATKIVLEPAGVAFEYIERARRSSPAAGGGGGGGGGSAIAGDHPPRARHTLDDFPPELQKKVTLLNHFRGYLHELVKKSEGGDAGPGAAGCGGGGETGAVVEAQGKQQPEAELTFLRKWMRTRNAILFRLSNRTVQVRRRRRRRRKRGEAALCVYVLFLLSTAAAPCAFVCVPGFQSCCQPACWLCGPFLDGAVAACAVAVVGSRTDPDVLSA